MFNIYKYLTSLGSLNYSPNIGILVNVFINKNIKYAALEILYSQEPFSLS